MNKSTYVFESHEKNKVIEIKTELDFERVRDEIEMFYSLNDSPRDVYKNLERLYGSDFSVKPVNSIEVFNQ